MLACACRYPDDRGGYSDKTVCITCQLPALTLAKDALWSMSRVGPFWKNVTGDWYTRIPEAIQAFHELHGGPPDAVVIASVLWYVLLQPK
jgi:hypothetical protein